MHEFSRRQFLEYCALGVGTFALGSCALGPAKTSSATSTNVIQGTYFRSRKESAPPYVDYYESYAFRFSPTTRTWNTVASDVAAHTVETLKGTSGNQTLLIPRFARKMSVIDWTLKKEVSSLELPIGESWYGHMIQPFSETVWVTGSNYATHQSYLNKVDLKSMKVVDRRKFDFKLSHDVIPFGSSEALLSLGLSTDSQPSSLAIASLNSSHIEVIPGPFKTDDFSIFGHALIAAPGVSLWQSNVKKPNSPIGNPRLYFFDHASLRFDQVPLPTDLEKSELLSIDLDSKTGIIWATFPNIGKVAMISVSEKKVTHILKFEGSPTAVHVPRNEFGGSIYVLVNTTNKVLLLDRLTGKTIEEVSVLHPSARSGMPNAMLEPYKVPHTRAT